MKFKKSIITVLFLLCVLMIGAVNATSDTHNIKVDNANDMTDKISTAVCQIIETSNNGNIQLVDKDNTKLNKNNQEDIMQSDVGKSESVTDYTGLVSAVGNAKSSSGTNYTITLEEGTYDYTSSITWGGSSTAKTLIINGNNQIINGNQNEQFIKLENGHT